MRRRDFLRTAVLSTAALSLERAEAEGNAARLARRPYKRGVELSIIGFAAIVVREAEPGHAARVVAESVEKGVNYFDVAPSYGDAEIKLGPALAPYRKDCFLSCKTNRRDRESAEREFTRSLERMQTDHFDLYQLHHITSVEKDVDAAFAPGGVMEMIEARKKAGQIRFVGFSAHSEAAALAAMERYDFDSAMFPVNFASWHHGNFGQAIVKRCREKGVAILALKALCRQNWPKDHPDRRRYPKAWYQPIDDRREAELALRWTLSQPVTTAIPPGTESVYRLGLELGLKYRPITPEEDGQLRELAATLDPVFRA